MIELESSDFDIVFGFMNRNSYYLCYSNYRVWVL